MVDYSTNDPKGWCGDPKRGAAMGRPTIHDAPVSFDGQVHLRRVKLDDGGYDPNGTYFGIGAPLYWYASDGGEIDAVLRAPDKAGARHQILSRYPSAQVEAPEGLDAFTAAYVTAMLWSTSDESRDDGGDPLDDNYDLDDLAPEYLRAITADCNRFQAENAEALDKGAGNDSQAGHDFWLTRTGHGAGFWDGDWPAYGDALTAASKAYGEIWPYVGDDGQVYGS